MRGNSSILSNQHGFTLTELAIVLGIMGLILGSIWVAAAQVSNHKKYTKAENEVLTIVGQIRSNFASQGLSQSANADKTPEMIAAGIIPSDMLTSAFTTGAASPWGTPFSVNNGVASGDTFNPMYFWIDFAYGENNLPPDVCANLITQIAAIPNIGLVQIFNGATYVKNPSAVSLSTLMAGCAGDASFQFSIQ